MQYFIMTIEFEDKFLLSHFLSVVKDLFNCDPGGFKLIGVFSGGL